MDNSYIKNTQDVGLGAEGIKDIFEFNIEMHYLDENYMPCDKEHASYLNALTFDKYGNCIKEEFLIAPPKSEHPTR